MQKDGSQTSVISLPSLKITLLGGSGHPWMSSLVVGVTYGWVLWLSGSPMDKFFGQLVLIAKAWLAWNSVYKLAGKPSAILLPLPPKHLAGDHGLGYIWLQCHQAWASSCYHVQTYLPSIWWSTFSLMCGFSGSQQTWARLSIGSQLYVSYYAVCCGWT